MPLPHAAGVTPPLGDMATPHQPSTTWRRKKVLLLTLTCILGSQAGGHLKVHEVQRSQLQRTPNSLFCRLILLHLSPGPNLNLFQNLPSCASWCASSQPCLFLLRPSMSPALRNKLKLLKSLFLFLAEKFDSQEMTEDQNFWLPC